MRKLGVLLLVAGGLVIVSYVVADLAMRISGHSNSPLVINEIFTTIGHWIRSIASAFRDSFDSFFVKSDLSVGIKGAAAAMILATILLFISLLHSGKHSGASAGRSSHRSRY